MESIEETVMSMDNFGTLWSNISVWLLNTGIKVVISIVLLIVSFIIINKISKKIENKSAKIENAKLVDKTLYRTLSYVFRVGLKILIVICIVGYLGIDTTSIAALIASLGVGVGLAVNGALSNFAGGIMLIIVRPFKDDDFISACGYEGTVEDIHITYTKIVTTDNKVVNLPNGELSASTIVNYTEKDKRRVDLKFSIGYSASYDQAKNVIEQIFAKDGRVLADPAYKIVMSAHNDSAIEITARAWVKTPDYWNFYFDTIEKVKKEFDANGIEIPFNQLDVHVKSDDPTIE